MRYRRWVVTGLLACCLLTVATAPGGANSCPDWRARSVVQGEESTWVLQSGSEGGPGTVYEYAADGILRDTTVIGDDVSIVYQYGEDARVRDFSVRIGNATVRNRTDYDTPRFSGLARARSSGWWALTERGYVIRYDDDWQPTGRVENVSRGQSYDLARTPRGWFVLDRGALRHYDRDWTDGTMVSSSAPGHGLYTEGATTWAVGYRGVYRYAVDDSGAQVRVERQATTRFDWGVGHVQDLTRARDGGWEVLEGDGRLVRFTGYWQYTTRSREVSDAIGYCGITLAPLVYAGGLGLLFSLSALSLVGLTWRSEDGTGTSWMAFVSVVASWTVGIAYVFYLLPWPLSLVYLIPDVVMATAVILLSLLTVAALHELGEYGDVTLSATRWSTALRRHPGRLLRLATIVAVMHLPSLLLAYLLVF